MAMTQASDTAPLARTALVTGAGRGIGRATALALSRQGLLVILTGRDELRLRGVAAEVTAQGGQADVLAGDMTEEAFWHRLGSLDRPVDVLVHNASQSAVYGLLEDVPFEQMRAVLDSVLMSGLRLSRQVLPQMKARGHGRIVFVGSLAWHLGAHGQAAYTAAKAGLQGLVRSLALEASRSGVTCNLVEPGFIDTPRTREAVSEPMWQALSARAAVGRAGTPEEVAAVIAFLASPDASYVTGATIPVSGGIELGMVHRAPPRSPSP